MSAAIGTEPPRLMRSDTVRAIEEDSDTPAADVVDRELGHACLCEGELDVRGRRTRAENRELDRIGLERRLDRRVVSAAEGLGEGRPEPWR